MARELTKRFEEVKRAPVADLAAFMPKHRHGVRSPSCLVLPKPKKPARMIWIRHCAPYWKPTLSKTQQPLLPPPQACPAARFTPARWNWPQNEKPKINPNKGNKSPIGKGTSNKGSRGPLRP